MENVTQRLAEFLASLNPNRLSERDVDQVKYLALDYIGLAARGHDYASTKAVEQAVRELSDDTTCTVVGSSYKTSMEYASLINGASAHSLELDDTSNDASLHPGAVIFPAAFAVAERVRASGVAWINAVICGYEAMIRIGKALNPSAHYERGFHPTGTCGVFAAAVTAGKLLGLDSSGLVRAMGIAGSQSAGSMAFLNDGAWTKRLHPGWAAHSGIVAAVLAKYDFAGPANIMDGRTSFLASYSSAGDPSQLVHGLGTEELYIHKVSIKPHACCRYNQGPIDAVLYLVREHDIQPEYVESIHVRVVGTAVPIVCDPLGSKRRPQSVVDAQFSLPFAIAVALVFRQAFLEQYQEEVLNDPRVVELMDRVNYERGTDLEREFPRKWPAEATIRLKDGRVYSTRIEYPKGDPENRLSWDELVQKFSMLSKPYFPLDQQRRIIEGIREIDSVPDIRFFTKRLAANE